MIISASRRTDIPNYYPDWFLNRLEAGFVSVRNPMNPHQISRISLSPEVVDGIVFWTKNPIPMLGKLHRLEPYAYYVQFTITGYGRDIEPRLPDKREALIPAFRRLSEQIGKERVLWRYDPIFFNDQYSMEYHLKAFEEIAEGLSGYTEKVVISFLDFYQNLFQNAVQYQMREMTAEEMRTMAGELVRIAARHGLLVETCAEKIDLQDLGIRHGCCINKMLLQRILGCRLAGEKDRNQRSECGCMESIDIGAYHTCLNGCKYCYANGSDRKAEENYKNYRPDAELLCGEVQVEDRITERKMRSLKDCQMSLF